jgi:hypothetical protein
LDDGPRAGELEQLSQKSIRCLEALEWRHSTADLDDLYLAFVEPRATALTEYWEAVRDGDPARISAVGGGSPPMALASHVAARARQDYFHLRQVFWQRVTKQGQYYFPVLSTQHQKAALYMLWLGHLLAEEAVDVVEAACVTNSTPWLDESVSTFPFAKRALAEVGVVLDVQGRTTPLRRYGFAPVKWVATEMVRLLAVHGDPLVARRDDDGEEDSFALLWRSVWGRVGQILGGDDLTPAERSSSRFWLGHGGIAHPGVTPSGVATEAEDNEGLEAVKSREAEQELRLDFLAAGVWQPTWFEVAGLEVLYYAHARRREALLLFRRAARDSPLATQLLATLNGRLFPVGDPASTVATFFDNLVHQKPSPEFGRMFRDNFYKQVPLAHLYPGEGELNVCRHRLEASSFASAATLAVPDEPSSVILDHRQDDFGVMAMYMNGQPAERVLKDKGGVALKPEAGRPRAADTERLMVAILRISFDGTVVQKGVPQQVLLDEAAWLDELEQDAATGRPLPTRPEAAYAQLGGDPRRKPAVIVRLMRRTFVLYERVGGPLLTLECQSLPHALMVWLVLMPRDLLPLRALPVPFQLQLAPLFRRGR